MSLILVATVGGVLLERVSVARRSDVWGYAGAEPGTRPETVRGPLPPCSTDHDARSQDESCGQEQSALPHPAADSSRSRARGGRLLAAFRPSAPPEGPCSAANGGQDAGAGL